MPEEEKPVDTHIRIPPDLYEQLVALARVEGRSVNSQLVQMLRAQLRASRSRRQE